MTPQVHDGVLFGADAGVAAWVMEQIPNCTGFGQCAAFGIVHGDRLVGGVVFSEWRPACRDVEVTGALLPGFRIGRAGVRRLLRYAFLQLGCVRITARTARRNRAARAFLVRMGFDLEGVRQAAHDGRQDQMMYGLLARKCRFLQETR